MKRTVLAALAAITIFASCEKENSEDVNQDKIYTAYELFYNSNTDVTTAVARFKFGGPTGTNLELTSGAYCLFGNDTLTYNNVWVGHTKDYPGLVTSGTFTYSDVNNDQYVNSTPVMDTAGNDLALDTIYKSQSNVLTWTGNPLISGEQINVFFGSWTWGQDAFVFQNQVGATDIVIGTNSTSSLAVGQSTVHLERVKTETLGQATSEGGTMRVKYKATNTTTEVVQ